MIRATTDTRKPTNESKKETKHMHNIPYTPYQEEAFSPKADNGLIESKRQSVSQEIRASREIL